MKETIMNILAEINDELLEYEGDNFFEDGLLDSFMVIDLVAELEERFGIEIDAGYVTEEHFKDVQAIARLMERLCG